MIASKVAKGARDLEPKGIQMIEFEYWMIRDHGLRKRLDASGQRLFSHRHYDLVVRLDLADERLGF
jgi:hypothetical protein